MTDDAIRQNLTAAVLEIDTPLGLTIPVRFSGNGIMSGEAGTLASVLGAAKDRGRWWTAHDQLCVKWFRWFDAKTRCITLRQDGKRIYWLEAGGESGTATIVDDVVTATVSKPAGESQTDDTAAAVAAPPALTIDQASSPTPAEGQRAPDATPPIRFATANLSEMVSTSPAEAGRLSRLGADASSEQAAPPATLPLPAKPNPIAAAAASPKMARSHQIPLRHAAPSQATSVAFRVAGVNVGDSLNVRRGPSELHATVGSISPTARGVRITGECRELWCPIRYGRVAGWVNRYYLAKDIEQDASQR